MLERPPKPKPTPVAAAEPVRRKVAPRPVERVDVTPPSAALAPGPALPVVVPKKPDTLTIEVIRGDKVTQQRFEKPDSGNKSASSKKPDSTVRKPSIR